VRDTEYGTQILGFAKWDLPGLRRDPPQLGVTWPTDCRREYLDEYYEKAEATKHRVIGDKPCYRKRSQYSLILFVWLIFFLIVNLHLRSQMP
jgi:hypothetical protein